MVVPPKHPKMIIFSRKPMVVRYHHFRKPPYLHSRYILAAMLRLPEGSISLSWFNEVGGSLLSIRSGLWLFLCARTSTWNKTNHWGSVWEVIVSILSWKQVPFDWKELVWIFWCKAKGSASEADAHDGNLGGWFGWGYFSIPHHCDTCHGTIAEKIRHHNGESWGLPKCPYTPIFRGLSRRIEWIPPLRLDQPVISTVRWRQEWSFCPQKKGKCHSCHQKICHDWRFCLLCQAQIASTSASSTADTQ